VYEGEYEKVKDNKLLGKFVLIVSPKKAGEVKIDVTFQINSDGILQVTAQELGSANIKTTQINEKRGQFTKDELTRMIQSNSLIKTITEID